MVLRAQDTYVKYITVQDREGESHSYFVVLCQNPSVTTLDMSINAGPAEKVELKSAPSVAVVELPRGGYEIQYQFCDAQGNAVR